MNDALQHYGVKGMKWGVRRYRDKKGRLTSEGKKHVDTYRKSVTLKRKTSSEIDNLMKSSKKLRADFGNNSSNVDDVEFFELVASGHGLNTRNLVTAYKNERDFYRDNSKSIKTGRKITEKLLREA